MTFRVGQEVVCVDDTADGRFTNEGYSYRGGLDGLTRCNIYTIRSIAQTPSAKSGIGIRLVEIDRSEGGRCDDTPYCSFRFRPIVKTDIGIFTAMLKKKPRHSPAKLDEVV